MLLFFIYISPHILLNRGSSEHHNRITSRSIRSLIIWTEKKSLNSVLCLMKASYAKLELMVSNVFFILNV